jgi:hypothetical protein
MNDQLNLAVSAHGGLDRPAEIVLSNYFSVRDDKIVSLVVIFNQPVAY